MKIDRPLSMIVHYMDQFSVAKAIGPQQETSYKSNKIIFQNTFEKFN